MASSPWDTFNTFPEEGSSGSGIFSNSKEKFLIGSLIGADTDIKIDFVRGDASMEHASALLNNWRVPAPKEKDGLAHFLDSDDSFLSNIPGGYLNDLVKVEPNTDFSLEMKPEFTVETPYTFTNGNLDLENMRYIQPSLLTSVDDNPDYLKYWFDINGIKTEELSDQSKVVFSVWYPYKNANDEYELKLLYGSYIDREARLLESEEYGFAEDFWRCDIPNEDYPSCNRRVIESLEEHESTDYKNAILEYKIDQSSEEKRIVYYNENIPVVVRLKNVGRDIVKVNAVSYPGEGPLNALQLFNPDALKNTFNYYKYPEHRGKNSHLLNIDRIKVEQEVYIYDDSEEAVDERCELLSPYELLNVTTENNGGYLNLVNYLYRIDNVLASDSRCGNNKLVTTLYTNETETNKTFSSFVDYDRQADPETYEYNLTNAISRIRESENPTKKTKIILEHDIPFQENLTFPTEDPSSIISARYRVGVTNANEEGEFEDYVLKVRKKESMSRAEWLTLLSPLILAVSATVVLGECLPDSTDIGDDLDTRPDDSNPNFQGIDATFPTHDLPMLGVEEQVCFDQLDQILSVLNTFIGANAVIFNGQMFIDIARGSNTMHETKSEQTISIDFMVDDINATNEILIEEGGMNGSSIIHDNGFITYGVKIKGHDQIETIRSNTTIEADKMNNVTAVFNEGVMELYINGTLQGEPNTTFSDKNITAIPQHPDDAGLGGTNGINIWDANTNYFEGVIDMFTYWTKALSRNAIRLLGRPINQIINNRKLSGKNSDKSSKIIEEEHKESSLSIFPNPAKNELNILVEVGYAGSVSVNIFDLAGKRVYEMKEPQIGKGHQLITLRNLRFSAGQYVVKIKAGNIRQSEQVVFE